MTIEKDAFGAEVNVGDYLVYSTKSQYSSFGMGLITKINPTGSLSMVCVEPWGQTIPEYIAAHAKSVESSKKHYDDLKAKHPGDAWIERYNPDSGKFHNPIVKTKRLDSASTCYRVPALAVPVEVIQLLQS